ncbi:AmmeMemoRadiSam system protein B [Candidatus Woesearchaeota archaeon]|nr:AmmeMemoRadiSam system protein B [Candidatus Woesearchaeota archaeon]
MNEDQILVRYPACAGTFYPATKEGLECEAGILLSDAKEIVMQRKGLTDEKIHRVLRAIVVPHGTYDQSGIIAAQGFSLLSKFSQHDHWKILLIGPSHYSHFPGAAVSTVDAWQTPLGSTPVNPLAASIAKRHYPALIDLPEVHEREHALEVQIPFLANVLPDFSIIPIATGEIDAEKLANIIGPYCDDETIIVVSADLSHDHSSDQAHKKDAIITKALTTLDARTLESKGESCAKIPLLALLHLAKSNGWKAEVVDYINAGRTSKDKSHVVGYGCFAFYENVAQ